MSNAYQVLSNPVFQAFSPTTGQFLVGGQLFTYAPGSTTPVASYPTVIDAQNLTNANTNPIILDSTGSASIIVSGPTKLVLKDATGNLIWSMDNVNLSSNNIYDSNGNALLLFSPVNSSVNYLQIGNNSSSHAPTLASAGADTNVGLDIDLKGNATLNLNTGITGTTVMQGAATVSGALAASSFNLMPSGMYGWFATPTAPAGWLVCNSAGVSRVTYASLFAAIGTTYGAGDGSTTFNLPNGARSTLVGSGGASTGILANSVGAVGGAETVTILTGNLPPAAPFANNTVTTVNLASGSSVSAPAIAIGGTWQGGGGVGTSVMQPSLVGLLCIKI
jgi:microcystin-dependent protein